MKEYKRYECPKGLKEVSHFFIQDKGRPGTRMEMYLYEVLNNNVVLPTGLSVNKGNIVHVQSHCRDNFNELSWIYSKNDNESFWGWFNRVFIEDHDEYEIFTDVIKEDLI